VKHIPAHAGKKNKESPGKPIVEKTNGVEWGLKGKGSLEEKERGARLKAQTSCFQGVIRRGWRGGRGTNLRGHHEQGGT